MSAKQRIVVRFDRRASVLGMMKWFAGQDIPVLPIHGVVDGRCTCGDNECSSPGKHPISSLVSHGVKDATTDLKTIRRWHRKYPDMNYAVATEELAVIDCDSKEALRVFAVFCVRRKYDVKREEPLKTPASFIKVHFNVIRAVGVGNQRVEVLRI